ncbi:MAG: Grx4 family monothiol glutaredoxin [Halobacteriovoraceae bacterium]|nr:Grx4 family monothiol glutaredoxin [Halobacteriovoraceae bacterium]
MNDQSPFNIISEKGENITESSQAKASDLNSRIEGLINSSDVFLFMKGNPDFPQCGFSANAVGILNQVGVQFKSFDILSDPEIRQGVKDFANWPTYPQLWYKGQLIGGNDIMMEMYHSGELEKVLK